MRVYEMSRLIVWILLATLVTACTSPAGILTPADKAVLPIDIQCHGNCSLQLSANGTVTASTRSFLENHCSAYGAGDGYGMMIICLGSRDDTTTSP